MARVDERLLNEWVDSLDLSDEMLCLIQQARMDLLYGPLDQEAYPDYPGWVTACNRIYSMLEDIPYAIWIDTESGCILESEPEGYWDDSEEPAVWMEPEWTDYVQVKRIDLIRHLVGSELAYHVS